MAADDIPGFDVDPDLEELLDANLEQLDEDTRVDLQLYKSRKLQAKRDADMSTDRPSWWAEDAVAPERMDQTGGGASAAPPADDDGEEEPAAEPAGDETGKEEQKVDTEPPSEDDEAVDETDETDEADETQETDETEEEPEAAEPAGASGGGADGQHGGRFPRHTGPPPEEIAGFDADPELEELLDRDVLELEEDVRQEVQLYRARKMKAARDAGMGTADTGETDDTAAQEGAEPEEPAGEDADGEEPEDEKQAPPPEEPNRYRGERKIGELVESRSGGREVTRRGFISTFGLGMAGMVAAFSAGGIGSLRYFFPNVLSNPPEQFVAGEPMDYAPGSVSTKYKGKYRVWLVNLSDRIVAIQAICTHLGCTPNWLDSQGIFKCPCHGSAYYMNGVNFAGPAPRPMARVGVRLNPQGKIIVDKGQVFTSNASPGWEAPDAFIQV